ncbi:MAG: molybdopterin-dependent oxidoreductase [Deltaproteobacteria bacterium]|nr:molybdopterin-dependent oxidoreductase [Deltaproteobacteria bacterium]
MQITINGNRMEAKEGQTVLQAALASGVYIPHLCYHEKVGAAGKCRACVVEIEGMRGLQTSCSVMVKEGMVVKSQTETALQAQRLVIDLMLSTGKHDCLACEQNGHCELQDAAYFLGIERPSILYADIDRELDTTSEFVHVDRNKCISCGRCVAACNGTVVNQVIDFGMRGHSTEIVFNTNKKMGDSTCVQCGECSQICPVGALIDKNSIGKGRIWELDKVSSVCPYCGVGCKLELFVDRKTNKIVKIEGAEDGPTNDGMLCIKGRYGYDFVGHPDRLKTPLIKENGQFREATWDEAIDLVVSKFSAVKEKYGPDSIMALSSAKVTNEENYTFQKLIRTGFQTNNVDHCARL